MTPQQQKTALGISADADNGYIVIDTDRPIMYMTPGEIRRFHRFLERAYYDATRGRERAHTGERVA